jgi:hypothetical protein
MYFSTGYYKTLPNICCTTSIHHENIYGHSSENFYDANLYMSSYIELETNTILIASGHNSYNRTIQIVPSTEKIHVWFIFYNSTQTVFVSIDKMMIFKITYTVIFQAPSIYSTHTSSFLDQYILYFPPWIIRKNDLKVSIVYHQIIRI